MPISPYTRSPLPDEFNARLRLITARSEATRWDDVMKKTFGQVVPEREETEEEREGTELRRKKAVIQEILERLDVYISLDSFLDSDKKLLPWNIDKNDETAVVNYLYERKDIVIDSLPVIYMIVKYNDNLRKLEDPDLQENREFIERQNTEFLDVLPFFKIQEEFEGDPEELRRQLADLEQAIIDGDVQQTKHYLRIVIGQVGRINTRGYLIEHLYSRIDVMSLPRDLLRVLLKL